ncbi:peptidase [Nocardioides sp. KIGAM211]|uniref:Peptidase n=1 Tax=Nocardioides luti TaxID=2761101 RepID=A0A7X0RF35_9ACTN|nr:peptidase [Nocardioides luti]MBB6627151.1 peptidase [Nocardioides luti]
MPHPATRRVIRPTRLAAVAVSAALAAAVLPLAPATAAPGPRDVPRDAPAAAHRPAPKLPVPAGWPFAQRLSHTSGTGVLHGGASYWSDFVYDDKGAAIPGGFTAANISRLAPTQGVYQYPDGPAHQNGADVFVAATGADASATYWRVDWNTLVDPKVPIAVWTFDTDDDATTGVSEWPADAGVTSPGIDTALVVSSRGARVIDLATGKATDVTTAGGRLTVDKRARSFVVKVPRSVLPASGDWRVRLGTGLASDDGTTMAAPYVDPSATLPVGAAHVYNLAFRSVGQEDPVHTDGMTSALVAAYQSGAASIPPFDQIGADGQARFVTGNFWMEDNQADTLAGGDVSTFSQKISWARLRAKASTREPVRHGYSNRWYVTSLRLGQGITDDQGGADGDGRPNYLGRIQPYGVYVPKGYRGGATGAKAPLTWVLHSLSVNHNQYGALNPRLLQQLCERRGSICATTLGFGPDGWYFDEAENDYWSVWRELGAAYRLDPRRTMITGYSMGGFATYELGLAHPDLYAGAVTLAGPPQCGVTLDGNQSGSGAVPGRCSTDGGTGPLVRNARWMPYRIGQGTEDQLVPFTSVEAQVGRFDRAGQRHLFVRYPGEDHLEWATQDRFDTVVDGLGTPRVLRNPPRINFTWRPHLNRPALGIGATTAYWLSHFKARQDGAGSIARVRARSFGVRFDRHGVTRTGPTPVDAPLPASVSDLSWTHGQPLPHRRQLVLRLDNMRSVTVDLARAGLTCGRFVVRSDGPSAVRLAHLPGRDRVLHVTSGRQVVRVPCR